MLFPLTRRRSLGGLAGVLAAFVGGCSSSTSDSPSTSGVSNASASTSGAVNSKLKVALLTPGDVNDQGWNQLAFEGLQGLEKSLGAQTAHQVTKNAADQQPALRDLADEKFDLVICHGFEYGERVKAIAPKYPNTRFVVVGGNVKQAPNVATLVPKLEDATFLLGMAAGGMTRSNVVGLLGGARLPVIQSTFDAFERGAKSVNPRVKVVSSFVGNFEDQNAAKEASRAMLAQGADFVFHNADQAGKGLFVAAQEAKAAGKTVYVFGSNRDQNSVAPTVCLASATIEMPQAFQALARDIQSGAFKPEFRELNLANGSIGVQWNPNLKSQVPQDLMKKIEVAAAKIRGGALKIERKV